MRRLYPFPAMRILLAATLLIAGSASAVFGGAWVQKKNQLYLKVSSRYLHTATWFNYRGERESILADFDYYQDTAYEQFALSTYVEYGLHRRLTIVAAADAVIARDHRTIVDVAYLDNARRVRSSSGLSDLELHLRIGILTDGPLILSLQPLVKVPLGYSTASDNDGPALGTGEVDVEGRLLAGTSFYPTPVYLSGEIGYRHRGGAVHDEIRFSAEAGLTLRRFLAKTEIRGIRNMETPPDIYGQSVITPLPGGGGAVPIRPFGDQHVLTWINEAVFQLAAGLGISAQLSHTLSGTNTVGGTTVALGMVLTR